MFGNEQTINTHNLDGYGNRVTYDEGGRYRCTDAGADAPIASCGFPD